MTRSGLSDNPRYFICTAANPWPKGGPVPVIHPDAVQIWPGGLFGFPGGDLRRCPHCGQQFELPQ